MSDATQTSQSFPDPIVAARWADRQLGIAEICELLPHRPPFLFVDRIIELVPGERAVGIKMVAMNEWYFAGHFPGHPIMPGMLILEALAQVGGVVVRTALSTSRPVLPYFTGVQDARFRQPVLPGDVLRLSVTVARTNLRFGKLMTSLDLEASVEGSVVASAVGSFALVPVDE